MGELASNRPMVLIVEDRDDVRRFMERILEWGGYDIASAANGEDALRLLPELDRVDLVLTDVVMPRLHGPQMVDRLVRAKWSSPVLFVTGCSDTMVERAGLRDPNARVLRKPFDSDDLLQCVDAALTEAPHRASTAPSHA